MAPAEALITAPIAKKHETSIVKEEELDAAVTPDQEDPKTTSAVREEHLKMTPPEDTTTACLAGQHEASAIREDDRDTTPVREEEDWGTTPDRDGGNSNAKSADNEQDTDMAYSDVPIAAFSAEQQLTSVVNKDLDSKAASTLSLDSSLQSEGRELNESGQRLQELEEMQQTCPRIDRLEPHGAPQYPTAPEQELKELGQQLHELQQMQRVRSRIDTLKLLLAPKHDMSPVQEIEKLRKQLGELRKMNKIRSRVEQLEHDPSPQHELRMLKQQLAGLQKIQQTCSRIEHLEVQVLGVQPGKRSTDVVDVPDDNSGVRAVSRKRQKVGED